MLGESKQQRPKRGTLMSRNQFVSYLQQSWVHSPTKWNKRNKNGGRVGVVITRKVPCFAWVHQQSFRLLPSPYLLNDTLDENTSTQLQFEDFIAHKPKITWAPWRARYFAMKARIRNKINISTNRISHHCTFNKPVSKPMPVFAPVTNAIFPRRSAVPVNLRPAMKYFFFFEPIKPLNNKTALR